MSNVTQLNIQIIDQDRPTIVEEEFNLIKKSLMNVQIG